MNPNFNHNRNKQPNWVSGMLNDNQIPGSSSNPGEAPYYPTFQPQFQTQEEMFMFNQFKQMQRQQQMQFGSSQQPYQFTTSQPNSEHASHDVAEDTEDTEEDPLPTPTSKQRKKSMSKRKEKEVAPPPQEKRNRAVWTQEEEKLLAECVIQVSEDPKVGSDQKKATFWFKIQKVYNEEAVKKGLSERTKNMLTGKWTPMNAAVKKFNDLVQETAVHSGENDDDWMARVYRLYDATQGGEFKHRSAWLFLKDKHKWKNPDSTRERRNRLMGTSDEPEHFGDDELPRPAGVFRINSSNKSQRTNSRSTASSGTDPAAYTEFMAEQYKLDREAKMSVLEKESEQRIRLIESQRISEDLRVLQIDTRGMDPVDAAIIEARKATIRATYTRD